MDFLTANVKFVWHLIFVHLHQLKDSMFLACSCNKQGSSSTDCNSDGDCYCKSNVINRMCNSCKNGFYGFPDCKGTIKGTNGKII